MERKNFCLNLVGLPKDTPLELYCFFRAFQNRLYDGDMFKSHRLHESMESELIYSEMMVAGSKLRYALLSARSCSQMRKYMVQHHQLDVLPIGQTLGFRQ